MLDTSSPNPMMNESCSFNDSLNPKNITMNNMVSSSRPTIAKLVSTKIQDESQNGLDGDDLDFTSSKKTTYEFKVILLGAIAVGKTSIFNRFLTNQFCSTHQCTVKAEFKSKIININQNSQAKLRIWDTSGDERYRSITRQYYRDAHGVLLVYDVTDRESFDGLGTWLADIRDNTPQNCVVLLAGNKVDLATDRDVTKDEADDFAKNNGLEHVEVSAKLGQNVFLLFEKLAKTMMDCIDNKNDLIVKDDSYTLDSNLNRDRNRAKKVKVKSGCC